MITKIPISLIVPSICVLSRSARVQIRCFFFNPPSLHNKCVGSSCLYLSQKSYLSKGFLCGIIKGSCNERVATQKLGITQHFTRAGGNWATCRRCNNPWVILKFYQLLPWLQNLFQHLFVFYSFRGHQILWKVLKRWLFSERPFC